MSKKEKFVLEFDEIEDDFFEDASILGIVCKEEAYHFVWACNMVLNTQLKLYKGVPVDSVLYNFNVYDYFDAKNFLQHYVYQLSTNSNNLLPELKNFDYVWVLKGSDERLHYLEKIIESLNTINKVQIITKLNESQLKHKTYLIL